MNASLREMRDQVYGQRCTNNNWDACAPYWKHDEPWIKDQYEKLPRPLPPHESLPWPKTQ